MKQLCKTFGDTIFCSMEGGRRVLYDEMDFLQVAMLQMGQRRVVEWGMGVPNESRFMNVD
jgi:hypothetical protein